MNPMRSFMVALIVAAEHPVPEAWLTRLFGWSKREAAAMLEGLGSLFERRSDGVAHFHKSLRDWLIDARAAGPAFVVDEADGSNRLATALWAEFANWAQRSERGVVDDFCVAELPAHARTAKGDPRSVGRAGRMRGGSLGPVRDRSFADGPLRLGTRAGLVGNNREARRGVGRGGSRR